MSGAVLLVAAERREFDGLAGATEIAPAESPLDFFASCSIRGRRVLLTANGAGPDRARDAVAFAGAREGLTAIVSIGYCGGLEPSFRAGDIFCASEIESGIGRFVALLPRSGRTFSSGRLVSMDRVVSSSEEKRKLRAGGALAVEMEAAGVARVAASWKVPFFCVRSVLDLAGEGFSIDFNAARDGGGRIRTSRILAGALARPWSRIPELIRLAGRARTASRTLGEFLADCDF